MRQNLDIRDSFFPVKKPVPSLLYDVALWCQYLMRIFPEDAVTSLHTSHFWDQLTSYAPQAEDVRPDSFPHRLRVYIFDNRLHPIFLAVDEEGELTTVLADFAHYDGHRPSDFVYGQNPDFNNPYGPGGVDLSTVRSFIQKYDIIPLEPFGAPTLVVFQGDQLSELRAISHLSVIRVLHQFQSENLIDFSQYAPIVPLW